MAESVWDTFALATQEGHTSLHFEIVTLFEEINHTPKRTTGTINRVLTGTSGLDFLNTYCLAGPRIQSLRTKRKISVADVCLTRQKLLISGADVVR